MMEQQNLDSDLQKKLYQAIYKRKSIRKYQMQELDQSYLNEIEDFMKQARSLDPSINYEFKIVNSDSVKSLFSIKAPHYLQFFSEKKGDYLLNAGFILEQLDLYLTVADLGSCWYGMAKAKKEITEESEFEYVITMAFGHPNTAAERDSIEDFDRKTLSEIKKGENHYDLLEAVRLAPSATNGQPWYFISEPDKIHVYQLQPNFLKKFFYKRLNRIDMGIAVAHLFLAAEQHNKKFKFKKLTESPAAVDNYDYLATVEL